MKFFQHCCIQPHMDQLTVLPFAVHVFTQDSLFHGNHLNVAWTEDECPKHITS
jgi:hypothetical protein